MSGSIAGCVATGKALAPECPIDGLLQPVDLSPIVPGEDIRTGALPRRTAEAITANARIVAGREYVKAHCGAVTK